MNSFETFKSAFIRGSIAIFVFSVMEFTHFLTQFLIFCSSVLLERIESTTSVDITAGVFRMRSVSQCYGRRMSVQCDPGHVMRVVTSKYRQTFDCGAVGSTFERRRNCSAVEPRGVGAAAVECEGRRECSILTPWIHLSSPCGYSNSFIIVYQCIPDRYLIPICSRASVFERRGILTSPNYPQRYAPMTSCSTTVEAPSGGRLRFQLLDIQLSTYRNPAIQKVVCVDRLWISDADNQSKYMCTGEGDEGEDEAEEEEEGRQPLVFGNQSTVHFRSGDRISDSARGFWLYFETVFDGNSSSSSSASSSSSSASETEDDRSSASVLPSDTKSSAEWHTMTSSMDPTNPFPAESPLEQGERLLPPFDRSHLGSPNAHLDLPNDRSSENDDHLNGQQDAAAAAAADDDDDGDDDGGIFPQKLIHLRSAETHPDLIVERIPWREQLRVESRTVQPGWLPTATTAPTEDPATGGDAGGTREQPRTMNSKHVITLGLFELSMMSGAISCGVIVIVAASLGCFYYLRRRRKTAYGEKMSPKRSYKNVIFAFGSNDTTPCSTPEPDFTTRQQAALDSNNSLSPYWWSSSKASNCHQGLLPIDETTEDLYEEVKRIRQRANPGTDADATPGSRSAKRQHQKRRIHGESPLMMMNPMMMSGRSQITSLNIELLGCQPQKSWNCQTLDSVAFTRELPVDVYGKLGADQPPKRRCIGGGGRRGERPPASSSVIIPMTYTNDQPPPHSFLTRCSNLPRLTANSIVDLSHEATLLDNDAKI